MLPKAVILLLVATISRQSDTSIAESLNINSQVVIRGQLQLVLNQLQSNNTI